MKQTIQRKDYLDGKATHEEYYGQFVNETVKNKVAGYFGMDRLRGSKDEHLNDIPLKEWDMCGLPLGNWKEQFAEVGDYPTKAGIVCILKRSAHEMVNIKIKGE